MGSGWSANSTKSSLSSSSDDTISGRRRPQEPETTTQVAGQKRRRTSNESAASSDGNLTLEPLLQRRKKRRLSKSGRSVWSSIGLSSAWNAFVDSASCYFARVFLYAAELAAMSGNPGELAGEEELVRGLIQSLDCFQSTNIDILRRGWRVLSVCSKECDPSSIPSVFQKEFTLESDLATVLTGMDRHSGHLSIQLLGFRALRTLVTNSDGRWETLAEAEAIPICINAMRIHSNDVVVQGLATTFLAMMVRGISSRPKEQVVNLGGVHLVMAAMRNFEEDPRLLHTACYALHQFGFTRRIREIVVAHDGIAIFLEAIENHLGDADLVDLCLSALGKLSDEGNLDWPTISPLILRTMARWPLAPTIQGHSLVLLIRATGQIPTSMVDGVIRYTIRTMHNFPCSANLQFFACAVLREILERIPTENVRARILAEGGMERILMALVSHRDSYGLQPMGLLALMNVWERRTPVEVAASEAFGGSMRAIAAVTGVHLELVNEDAN